MTAKRERSSELVRATVVLAALGLAACSTVGSPVQPIDPGDGDGDGDGAPVDGNPTPDGDDGNPGGDGGDGEPNLPCGEATETARAFVEQKCAGCHGATPSGRLKDVLSRDALVDSGWVIPDDPINSPLYERSAREAGTAGVMPPAGPGSTDEVKALADWITCGAPDWDLEESGAYEFVSINERLELMRDDIRSVNEADRPDVRYFGLHNLSNAGFSKKQVEDYASAMSFVMNSLSTGLRVVPPRQVDDQGLLFRIELGDYGWDAAKWDLLTEVYPYMVEYDEDNQIDGFDFNETDNEDIRDETEEEIPYINVDWFISHAIIPPLYHQLLGIPGNGEPLEELEAQLGIDVITNIENGEEVRSGFLSSQPSDANRIIARHDLPGNQGAFWISYDFVNNIAADNRDIKVNPLDPDCDGGEAIFTLPNGLQGYYVVAGCPLVRGASRELNIAPIGVVQDPASFDGQVTTGLSCLTCHATVGIIPKADEIRNHVTRNGVSGGIDIDDVLELYPPQRELEAIFDDDSAAYKAAFAAANADRVNESTIHTIHQKHLDEIDLKQVASLVGLDPEVFKQALDSAPGFDADDPNSLPASFDTLTDEGGQIDRDALDADFQQMIRAINLGAPIVPQN